MAEFARATAENFRSRKELFRAIVERGMEHPVAIKTIVTLRKELAAAPEKAPLRLTRSPHLSLESE